MLAADWKGVQIKIMYTHTQKVFFFYQNGCLGIKLIYKKKGRKKPVDFGLFSEPSTLLRSSLCGKGL